MFKRISFFIFPLFLVNTILALGTFVIPKVESVSAPEIRNLSTAAVNIPAEEAFKVTATVLNYDGSKKVKPFPIPPAELLAVITFPAFQVKTKFGYLSYQITQKGSVEISDKELKKIINKQAKKINKILSKEEKITSSEMMKKLDAKLENIKNRDISVKIKLSAYLTVADSSGKKYADNLLMAAKIMDTKLRRTEGKQTIFTGYGNSNGYESILFEPVKENAAKLTAQNIPFVTTILKEIEYYPVKGWLERSFVLKVNLKGKGGEIVNDNENTLYYLKDNETKGVRTVYLYPEKTEFITLKETDFVKPDYGSDTDEDDNEFSYSESPSDDSIIRDVVTMYIFHKIFNGHHNRRHHKGRHNRRF